MPICLLLLSACMGEQRADGKVVEAGIEEGAGVVSLVIRTDAGKEIGVLVTDETRVISLVDGVADGVTAEEFKTGAFSDIAVAVDYESPCSSFARKDGREITAYQADTIMITGFLTSETATLSDGTSVGIWNNSGSMLYTLENGTKLLRVSNPSGPDNTHVGGTESFDDLGEAAQRNVLKFYENQGLLYDLDAELQKAYEEYLAQEDKSKFNLRHISQDKVPTASNERVMCFLTAVFLPIDSKTSHEYRIGAVFDRETGEVIDNWDLFSRPPEEAKQKILDIAGVTDPVLRKEMEAAFQPESIILFQDNMQVCFQQGTLPSQEHTYMLGLDYDEKLAEILNEWAVPQSGK